MEKMGLNKIRKLFLDFFESKDHFVRPSFSLVPEADKSLLLINSGMAPLKPYFMGVETPPKPRMVTAQKCIRTGDIENVGRTARHATFFEMLGNFSFGDYFKKESISWGWELVTEHLKMPEDKLWVSIYENDDESFEIWNQMIGFPKERIVRLGKADNFWEIGLGPCGPCSEIYFDRGEKYGCGDEACKPGCECDRFVEFWNHVFTQYDKDEEGNYNPLPNPNIDTGMGLERVACIMQGVDTIFEVDTIKYILDEVAKISNQTYGANPKNDTSIRIVTDHIRSVTFMVSDGIMPSNEGRGYVLRRLLRRASRHGKLLGIKDNFLLQLVDKVIDISGEAYPELIDKMEYIKKIIEVEEQRFQETIDQGSDILKDYSSKLREENKLTLSGEEAFKLYDTYGFPLELTKEILEEEGMQVDEEGFKSEMQKQKERARNARHSTEGESWKEDIYSQLGDDVKSKFEGYSNEKTSSKVLAIVKNGEILKTANQGDSINLILDITPFYPEGGGQAGDIGIIYNETCKLEVIDCKKGNNNRIIHMCNVLEGSISVGSQVNAQIDKDNRLNTMRNHTATHLLHKALKEILGEHVEQSGSMVTSDKLRFDFTHFQALTPDEINEIEKNVNMKVLESLNVSADEMGINEAKEKGATALFGEKYGDVVRVISMGNYSMELCGGTHLNNTSQIGSFKIISESGVAAGIRRIEAITGIFSYEYSKQKDLAVIDIAKQLKTNPKDISTRLESLLGEMKAAQKEIEVLKRKLSSSSIDEIMQNVVTVGNVNIITSKIKEANMDQLRDLGDRIKDKLGSGVVVLASENNNKVSFVVMATDDVVKLGVHAGKIIKPIAQLAGGGGGGKPTMAQAGAKDPTKIDEALQKVSELVKEQIN